MLQKWKFIINNWINCYFDKTSQDECHVNIESLLTIISNLRDNLNLDESKSSVLEAHTVEEFILEKYPGFKFKNGSIKASNEDDVYFAASLLLYFVCVNSKDMDMKSAMCSKLSGDDQEIILKFSKTLMDCSPITCEDVQAAIAEACSNEMATIDTGHVRVPVAETPPALRSLHGEVRRLQAALEAERFDRNFLQEELARTNLRVEKLLKDKEQYKLDIMNLKTKISLCCGENHDGRQAETGARESAKLARQLQDMEERLVRTQEMLDEAVYERDGLKAKLEGMKQDRDKWLALSQQESARTVQLTEELETERRQVLSLRELITELRMHNRLNRLDSSLLECDDPDASIQSLGHNLSVCSEACANIIDVQLGEERAKNAQLKQQIETLQKENEQLQFAIEEDNSNHELILKEKDLMINNLEQQLKQQATLLESLRKDHETVTLSWEKHKLKTRDIIEVKDEHIKKLNDHLVSLKQEFAELEIVRDTLKKNIDVLVKEYNDEKENLVSLLDEEKSKYDVILQEKDMLQNQLLEEKAAKDILETEKVNLIATHNELSSEKAILANELAEEKSLRQVLTDKKNELSAQKVATEKKFSKQVKQVEKKLAKEVAKVAVVLQEKEQIVQQLKEEKSLRESAEKEKADLVIEKTHLEKAKEELKKEVDQLFANRDSLEQNCLEQKEINIELKEELEKEKLAKNDLFQEKEVLKRDLVDHKAIQEVLNNDKKLLIEEKNGLIQSLELEKSAHDELENEKTGLCSKLKVLNEQFVSELKSKEDELEKATEGMKQLAIKFKGQKELTHQISATLHVALGKLTQELNMKEFTNTDLQDVIKVEDDDMSAVEKCDLLIHISNALYSEAVMKIDLEKDLESKKAALEEAREVLKQNEMQIFELQAEMKQLQQIATEAKSELIKQNDNYTSALKNKQTEIQSLQHENQHLKNDLNTTKIQLDLKVNSLKELLVNKENATDQLKEQYECQINNLNVMVNTLTNYLEDKTAELECAGNERDWLQQVIEENHKGIKSLQNEVDVFRQSLEKVVSDCESDKLVLKNMVTDAESMMENQKLSLNNTISELTKANNMLQNENKSIKDLIEKKTELFEREINKKESTLKSTEKELIELKIAKQDIEQKIILQKEVSDKELGSLRAENQNKHDENRRLKDKMRAVKAQKKVLNQEINELKAAIQDKENKLKTMVIDKNEYETTIRNYEETIKCLEEEVKNEKLNQEKLMEDFESERQIIKNMVAVTESVMEDQKVTFNNIILEQTKTIKMVKEENRSIVEEIEIKKKEFEIKLQEKQTALEMLLKELAEVKQGKENEKKDKILQKEMLETEINDLKSAIQKKEDESKRLTEEINLLAATNQNYKEDAASLANENNELKIKNDEIQVEFRNKVEKLTASLQEQIDNKKDLNIELDKTTNNIATMESQLKDLKEKINTLEQEKSDLILEKDGYLAKVNEIQSTLQTNLTKASEEIAKSKKDVNDLVNEVDKLKSDNKAFEQEIDKLKSDNSELSKVIDKLKNEKDELSKEIVILKIHNAELSEGFDKLKTENNKLLDEATKSKASDTELVNTIEEKITAITKLEQVIKQEQEKHKKLQDDIANEKVNLVNKCDILENYHTKAEKELEERQKEILSLQKEVKTLQAKVEYSITQSAAKDGLISKMSKEKDAVISDLNKNLLEEKVLREKYQREFEEKIATICELKKHLNEMNNERKALSILKKENEELIKAVGQRETFAVRSHENTSSRKYSGQIAERELRDIHHQVDNTSDITHSSIESLKTITDLEKIIHDKNRTITTLQSDVTYLKTLMAESENKLLDVTKELEVSKENCQQLSIQLKKIVQQKNEEITEYKKQVSKMSVTENRATQIIKVSAKYQAIILKRIAEIKSSTVLKELTNFGNSNTNTDSELRRSLTAGSITMEDLENFLETTERHLKKCSDKQLALQKEKDRLTEVNRIHESEIINLKKFLTELSVSFQTFSSVKDLYAQKLSRVISVQRTVRREILSLDGHVTDTCMLKLERGYAAVMQDLAECSMNLERWVERCIARTISSEKIKQAFMSDNERSSLAPSSVQNAGLEVQLDELEKSFQKLLEEVSRAQKGEGAKDAQAVTLMEVRAEYEDKLNRMKSKMKQLYTEQIAVFKEKQKEEIAMLERELARARDTLSQSSRAYEEHIRSLTTELWSVGEKFLMQKDEANFLRRKQRSGSLMSLQHVHSSGFVPPQEDPGRPSDTQSLRSLPVNNNNNNNGAKKEGRGLHMSDEEGEVFDNRYLRELTTPRRDNDPARLSELRWRNSLCPPHLKSSYPAETQFAPVADEDDIKAMGGPGTTAVRQQRKEVGIIAYKKPGPPTPSKQAGRLSATDSELRESMRVEAEPQASRKTSTPSRIRSLFRSNKTDTTDGTPRSRRLSNIFRKK